MSSTINVHQIVAVLQAEVASRVQRNGRQHDARPRLSVRTRSAQDETPESLALRRVRSQLVDLVDDDPQRERKLLRLFIESVLAARFGDALLRDPAFFRMVEDVRDQMMDTPALAPAIEQLMKALGPQGQETR